MGAEEKAAAKEDAAPPLPPNTWHGTVGCAKCAFGKAEAEGECAAALKTASDGILLLKAGQRSPPAIRSFLTRIRDGKMTGDYLCTGELSEVDGQKCLVVKTMLAKPLPKGNSELLTYRTNRGRPSATGEKISREDIIGGGDEASQERRKKFIERIKKMREAHGDGDRHRERD